MRYISPKVHCIVSSPLPNTICVPMGLFMSSLVWASEWESEDASNGGRVRFLSVRSP